MSASLPARLRGLAQPSAFPHRVDELTVIETHISWVILTGDFAYKIKKNVAPGFLDFSTLSLRHQACVRELELNRRLAPQLYLEVVAITGTGAAARIGGDGTATEYAVRMRQFDAGTQLDRMLADGRVDSALMRALARRIGRFHERAPAAPKDGTAGRPADILRHMLDNFPPVRSWLELGDRPADLARLDTIEAWTRQTGARLEASLGQRLASGRVREGHGDLHLSNLVCLDDGVTAFDCIEFSAELRWIDVISDTGFLVMDLEARERRDLAFDFLNGYLEYSGDYAGVAVLDLYLAYRSMVRAKVACLLLGEIGHGDEAADGACRRLDVHLGLAARIAGTRRRGHLILMHGLSGSGKSWLSERLAGRLGAIRVRSDVERKRLAGIDADQRGDSALDAGLYDPRWTRATYRRLREVARQVLGAGMDLIVDAAFLSRSRREEFARLADGFGIPWTVVTCSASPDELSSRIRRRAETGKDASDAGLEVLRQQQRTAEALTPQERQHAVQALTGAGNDVVSAVAAAVNRRRSAATDRPSLSASRASPDPAV